MSAIEESVRIPVLGVSLSAEVMVPTEACGLVILTHNRSADLSGPLTRMALRELHGAGFGTVVVNLLTRGEEDEDEVTGQARLNVMRLARRVVSVTDWVLGRTDLGLGFIGSDTCAAAALVAAAKRPRSVRAVVSQSGRPDLADDLLRTVYQPTLLVVGRNDGDDVIELNRRAMAELPGRTRLDLVAGSIRQPCGPATLHEPVRLATGWFIKYLAAIPRVRDRTTDDLVGRPMAGPRRIG